VVLDDPDQDVGGLLGVDVPGVDEVPQAELGVEDRPDPRAGCCVGLSMDYEVFLLSRVKESWDRTRDHHEAVAAGLASTGRVITCAALIMIAVFISFVTSTNVVIKQLSVGLAASILIDATVVRLLLVPAVMYLLGRSAWWLPKRLARLLPRLDVEGTPEPPAITAPPATASAPVPASRT
jgi:putative drug exporter of the RND superfamily